MKNLLLLACTFFPSTLRLFIWKILGFKVGKKTHVSIFTIVVADFIAIESGSSIDALSFIYRPSSLQIGKRVRVASFVRIIGRGGEIKLGSQSFVGLGCLIDSSGGFITGTRSVISPRTLIYSHGSSALSFNVKYPHRFGPVTIGEDSWIGMGCIIFPNVNIGKNVIIYPGSRVFKDQKDKESLIPFENENKSIATNSFIMGGVSDRVLQDKIHKLFIICAHYLGSKIINDNNSLLWKIEKINCPTLYLFFEETAEIKKILNSSTNAIIWKLYHNNLDYSRSTVFCFNDWKIYGPMTTFTESIADLLMKNGGPHFIYKE